MSENKTKQTEVYEGKGFTVVQFKTADLAVFSYFVESQGRVLLVDPTIETSAYRSLEQSRKSKIDSVFLSHIHADFVSGHLEFEGATIYLGAGTETSFKHTTLKDEQQIAFGDIRLRAVHTPGHTLESTCLLLIDADGKEQLLFTGDTLFLGGVGRPDLAVKGDLTERQLASLLYDSLQKIKALPNQIRIYPAHGAGSSCGKSIDEGNHCFIGTQKLKNYALLATDKQSFINQVTQITSPPLYFSYDAKVNRQGPFSYEKELKNVNNALKVEEFAALSKEAVVIDFRSSKAELSQGVIKGSLIVALVGKIATWVGSLLPSEQNILIYTNPAARDEILQRLLRIGYVNIKGYNDFTIEDWVKSGRDIYKPRFATLEEFQNNTHNRLILDVRTAAEWEESGVFEGSKTVYFPDLQADIAKNRADYEDKQIFVHCKMGYRATAAGSILERHGIHNNILLNTWNQLTSTNVKVVKYVKS